MKELNLQQFSNHLAQNPDCLAKAKEFGDDMAALAAYAHELGYEVTAEELTVFRSKTRQTNEAKWKEIETGKESLSDGAKQFLEFSKLADTDPEVEKRITKASKSPQELITYGKEKGFTFDTKDMEEVAKKLMEQEEELSDEDLEAVAGGITVVGAAAVVGFLLGAGLVVTLISAAAIVSVAYPDD